MEIATPGEREPAIYFEKGINGVMLRSQLRGARRVASSLKSKENFR